jgi:hypothetical protein
MGRKEKRMVYCTDTYRKEGKGKMINSGRGRE